MLRRILQWLVGRKEPDPDLRERDRRLAILDARVELRRRTR